MPDVTGDQPGAACAEYAKILQRIFKVGKPGMQGLLNNGIINRNHTDQKYAMQIETASSAAYHRFPNVSTCASCGNRRIQSPTTSNVPIPPISTDDTVPNRAAVAPDSNSPS